MAVLDLFEELYYAIYTAQKTDLPVYVHSEIFEYYLDSLGLADQPEAAESEAENSVENVKSLRFSIKRLSEETDKFQSSTPLVEMIKYFRADPYYRMLFYLPTLKLKEFYHYALRVKILSQFEDFFKVVRSAAVKELISTLFEGSSLKEFSFYRDFPDSAAGSVGLPRFAFIKTLTVMNNFLLFHYRRKVLDLLEMINKLIAGKKRDTQMLLMSHASALEDIIEKLRLFDLSLAPESEDGKTFFGVRFSIEGDQVQQRMYQSLVARKDKEARDLFEKGIEHMAGLQRALEDVLTVIQNINTGRILFGGDSVLDSVEEQISKRAREIAQFRKLIIEVKEVEGTL